MERINERFLVEKARLGDLKAFEELLLLNQDHVYTLALRLTADAEEAKDLAQEAFIKAYIGINKFHGNSTFKTWIHRVTINVWIDSWRKREKVRDKEIPLVDSLDEELQVPAPGKSLIELVEDRELQEHVQGVLYSLSDEHRTVLVLREIEGYSYEEIAQCLGCSTGTVKSRLNRARRAFKQAFLERLSGPGLQRLQEIRAVK